MEENCKYIFLHIPKTGGTFFRRSVLSQIWPKQITMDFTSKPWLMHKKKPKCNKIICGHFPYSKYEDYGYPYITWLRHPIERVYSHYRYSKINPKWLVGGDAVQNMESFESFIERTGNLAWRFFEGHKLEDFLFVGVLEYYESSIKKFANIINKNLSYINLKRTGNIKEPHPVHNDEILDLIIQHNNKDLNLWEQAIKKLING